MTTSAKSKNLPEDTVAKVGLYRFLSRCFRAEVDTNLLEILRLPDIADVLIQAEPSVAESLSADWTAAEFEEAAIEFCRLFVVPGVCVPIASAWRTGGHGRSKTDDRGIADLSKRLSESLELTLADDLVQLPPDHVSVLLEIAAWLEEHGDAQAVEDFENAALRPWLKAFAERLQREAELPIYRALGIVSLNVT